MPNLSRRTFFNRMADGLHGAALLSLLGADLRASEGGKVYDLKPKKPHFTPKAKAVIHLFQNGGPSQVDLFDPTHPLPKFAGTPPPPRIVHENLFAAPIGTTLP